MHDAPGADQLVRAVAAFLRDEALPALAGPAAFRMRVAANLLDIAARELAQGPRMAQAELASLGALLGEAGSAGALRRTLCERIAAGELDAQTPGLAAHLWRVTLDKLAVDQPHYAAGPGARPSP